VSILRVDYVEIQEPVLGVRTVAQARVIPGFRGEGIGPEVSKFVLRVTSSKQEMNGDRDARWRRHNETMNDTTQQVNVLVKELLALNHLERISAFRRVTAEEAGLWQSRRLKIRQALVMALAVSRA
jgi:hypothetical protein